MKLCSSVLEQLGADCFTSLDLEFHMLLYKISPGNFFEDFFYWARSSPHSICIPLLWLDLQLWLNPKRIY